MDDLINRQDAINLLKKWADGYKYIETDTELAIKEFKYLPSAQPEPVRRGRWEDAGKTGYWCKCSECGMYLYKPQISISRFCPSCGAKMEDERSE